MKVSSRSIKVASLIHERTEFETYGALSAEWNGGYPLGQLPQPWRDILIAHTTNSQGQVERAYVVYSYQTPIAWWTKAHGWVIPPVKYSRTTSVHQGKLYLALASVRPDTLTPSKA